MCQKECSHYFVSGEKPFWSIKFSVSVSMDRNESYQYYLRNECLFFWVHGEWIVARDKQIAWTAKRFSADLFVPRYDSFPMNPEKKTLIPYIYNASNEGPFLKFSEKNYKFKIPTVNGMNLVTCASKLKVVRGIPGSTDLISDRLCDMVWI